MNENQNDRDEHMSTILFFYIIVFKIRTNHTPFQLVNKLHMSLPIKYMLPSKLGQNHDPTLVRVLTNRLLELKKL